MKALVVAGARPNFIKVAPLLEALRGAGHRGVLVHTGQHYDVTMSDSFFRDLGLPPPDHQLGVGSGTHARQIARVMERFEPVLLEVRPIAETMPVVFPMHPRTGKNVEEFGLLGSLGRLITTEPLGYIEMLSLSDGAAVVLTDSGGLQEETTVLGVPCVTLRARTERPITLWTRGLRETRHGPHDGRGVDAAAQERTERHVRDQPRADGVVPRSRIVSIHTRSETCSSARKRTSQ